MRRLIFALSTGALVAGLLPSNALAQDAGERQEKTREVVQGAIEDDAGYGGHGGSVVSGFSLVASDDSKIATVALEFDAGNLFGGEYATTSISVTATTDLAKKGHTSFGDLASGLTGGTSVEIGVTHYSGQFKPAQIDYGPVNVAIAKCESVYDADLNVLKDQVAREVPGAKDRLKELPKRADVCDPAKYQQGGVSTFVERYNPDGVETFTQSVLPGGLFFFGAKGKLTQTDFSYLDRTAFATKDDSKFGYSGRLLMGWLFPSGRTSVTGSIAFGRTYKAADDVTICQPIAAPQTQCITGADGGPTAARTSIGSIELRHAFRAPAGKGLQVAIAPLFSIDFRKASYSVDVPIYLVGDGKGKLRGGLRVTYENERKIGGGREDGVKFGVFVGVPFSVFQ